MAEPVDYTCGLGTTPEWRAAMGNPRPVGAEEAEQATLVVCVYAHEVSPEMAPTSIIGLCPDCRALIAYQRHAPKHPPKVCWPCAAVRVRDAGGRWWETQV